MLVLATLNIPPLLTVMVVFTAVVYVPIDIVGFAATPALPVAVKNLARPGV